MKTDKLLKKYWWIGVIIAILYVANVGGYLGQIYSSKTTLYVGETTKLTFYCGTSVDRVQTCSPGENAYFTYQRQGGSAVTLGYMTLQYSTLGTMVSFDQSFNQAGIYDIDFCVGSGFDRCESKTGLITVLAQPTPAPSSTPVPTPQCATSWTCKDSQTFGYKNADCTYSNLQTCQYGCDSSSNSCRPAPTSTPSQCNVGLACKDANTVAYRNSDCSWASNSKTCQYGCYDNLDGFCVPSPSSSPTPSSGTVFIVTSDRQGCVQTTTDKLPVPPTTTYNTASACIESLKFKLDDNQKMGIVVAVIFVGGLLLLGVIKKKKKRRH